MKVYYCMDLGGTKIRQGLLDAQGRVLWDETSLLPALAPDLLVKELANRLRFVLAEQAAWKLAGLGLAAANANYFSGCVEQPANLPWPSATPLRAYFQAEFPNLSVVLDNDANAAALGELFFGRGYCNFIFVTLGTGLGSGLVLDGKLWRGKGLAGELGHVVLYPEGRTCGCGRQGCAETYCSGPGLAKTHAEILNLPQPALEAWEVVQAAEKGNATALEALDLTAKHLALLLSNSVAYTQPEALILDGGLCAAGPLLMQPLRRYFDLDLLHVYKKEDISLELSDLPSGQAALLGALSLVLAEESEKKS